jgi:hypothetical protein
MNVIDSTLWLEYFPSTEAGNIVSEIIENTNELIVPTITSYEVEPMVRLYGGVVDS